MPFSNLLKILNLVLSYKLKEGRTPAYFSAIALTLTLYYTAFDLEQGAE